MDFKLKLGDRVRIVKKVSGCARGWTDAMDTRVNDGDTYTIKKSGGGHYSEDFYRLQECAHWWPAEALELAEKEPGNYFIHVLTAALSRAVQERLFDLGYRWMKHGEQVISDPTDQHGADTVIYVANENVDGQKAGTLLYGDLSPHKHYSPLTIDELFIDDFPAYKDKPEPIMIAGEPVEKDERKMLIYIAGEEWDPDYIAILYKHMEKMVDVYGKSVSFAVGCETIPLEKIKQIVERYCE